MRGLVVAYNVLVILWGAVVRATGSGAGCGDNWPLCNGDFFPHHPRLATIIEFAHRSMTGVSTVLVIGLVVWTFYAAQRGTSRPAGGGGLGDTAGDGGVARARCWCWASLSETTSRPRES